MAANVNIYVAGTVAAGVLANSRRHAASFKLPKLEVKN